MEVLALFILILSVFIWFVFLKGSDQSFHWLFISRKSDKYRELVGALLGDQATAERLILHEQRKKGLNRVDAIRHAVIRLERDRR